MASLRPPAIRPRAALLFFQLLVFGAAIRPAYAGRANRQHRVGQ